LSGQHEADLFLLVYTISILERLGSFNHKETSSTPKDIYAMQLLCYYDKLAGKAPPLMDLFDKEDWLAFEYMRDVECH